MNPFPNTSQQRGSSIYNICAPNYYSRVIGGGMGNFAHPKFTDSYYKSFHSTNPNPINTITMDAVSSKSMPPPRGFLDSFQGMVMNVLKLNPPHHSNSNQTHVRPKEFNFDMNPHSNATNQPTSPIKIDIKQAGKSHWPHPQSPHSQTPPTMHIQTTVGSFTFVSPFLDNFAPANSPEQQIHMAQESAGKPMQKILEEAEEEDFGLREEKQINETETVMANKRMTAELKRLKKINKCKHRFNPLKLRPNRSKETHKNSREKQRQQIGRDIKNDCQEDEKFNESLEALRLEKRSVNNVPSTPPIPIHTNRSGVMHTIPETSPEDFSSASFSLDSLPKLPPDSDDEYEFVIVDKSTPTPPKSAAQENSAISSTPPNNISPRKTLGLCEKFNKLFVNTNCGEGSSSTASQELSPVKMPMKTALSPFKRRERTVSECSEDSFVVFAEPDGKSTQPDFSDFEGADLSDSSDSGSEDDSSDEDSDEDDTTSDSDTDNETDSETETQFPYSEVHAELDNQNVNRISRSTKKSKSKHDSKQPDSGFDDGKYKVSFSINIFKFSLIYWGFGNLLLCIVL